MRKDIQEINKRKKAIRDLSERASEIVLQVDTEEGGLTQKILEILEIKNKKLILRNLGAYTLFAAEGQEGELHFPGEIMESLDELGLDNYSEEERGEIFKEVVEKGYISVNHWFDIGKCGIENFKRGNYALLCIKEGPTDVWIKFKDCQSKYQFKNDLIEECESKAIKEMFPMGVK